MDGYALRHADIAAGLPLKVIGTAFAGRPFNGTVQPGECVRIMTGAVVPEGTDSVVMQEHVPVSYTHLDVYKRQLQHFHLLPDYQLLQETYQQNLH